MSLRSGNRQFLGMKMANLPNKYIKALAGARDGSSSGSSATKTMAVTGGKSFPENHTAPNKRLRNPWNRQ